MNAAHLEPCRYYSQLRNLTRRYSLLTRANLPIGANNNLALENFTILRLDNTILSVNIDYFGGSDNLGRRSSTIVRFCILAQSGMQVDSMLE